VRRLGFSGWVFGLLGRMQNPLCHSPSSNAADQHDGGSENRDGNNGDGVHFSIVSASPPRLSEKVGPVVECSDGVGGETNRD
jgi:hypothetical protein